jgi:spore coat polysaccharide biosynthesis protein SpsF
MSTSIFIQARMGSTRLPGKVLLDLGGLPVLVRQWHRVRETRNVTEVVVITSTDPGDDPIEEVCKTHRLPSFRGSRDDCLDRHYKAAKYFKSDFIFKIPSDCPLSDPQINTKVVKILTETAGELDYVSNYHPPTFPDGLDCEGCTFDILERAWVESTKAFQREHTFPYVWDNPELFSIGNLVNPVGNMFMTYRWTLDYKDDYDFIKRVYQEFDYSNQFYFKDIIELLNNHPEISAINSHLAGINWYRNESDHLKTVEGKYINNSDSRVVK